MAPLLPRLGKLRDELTRSMESFRKVRCQLARATSHFFFLSRGVRTRKVHARPKRVPANH